MQSFFFFFLFKKREKVPPLTRKYEPTPRNAIWAALCSPRNICNRHVKSPTSAKNWSRKYNMRCRTPQPREPVWPSSKALSPFLTGRMFVRPNILRTLRRTMIRFLIELLDRRIWFGQSKLYFILDWLVMRCKLRSELAADAQQAAWSKM